MPLPDKYKAEQPDAEEITRKIKMTKTEKIIRGLECCTSGLGDCDKCPYDYVTDCQTHEGCLYDAKELLTSCKNLRFFVKENPDGFPIEFKIAFKLAQALLEQNIIKITTRKYGDSTIINVKFDIKQLCEAGFYNKRTVSTGSRRTMKQTCS